MIQPAKVVEPGTPRDAEAAAASPRVVPCKEQGPIEIPLDEILGPAGELRANPETQRYFDMRLKKGTLSLRARGFIGQIPLSDRVIVEVQPRVPVRNLSRIIGMSGVPPTSLAAMRNYATSDEWSDTLLDLYAGRLISHIEQIATSGLLREYAEREEMSSFPRGRVLLGRSLQTLRSRGVKHIAAVAWHERSHDNPPNRCLKYAAWLIVSRYMEIGPKDPKSLSLHRRLTGLYPMFEGVELDHSRTFLADERVQGTKPLPSTRAYYGDALGVARATIEQRGVLIEDSTGPLRMPSIVLDMDVVFEAYVRNALREHAAAESWAATVLDGNREGQKGLYNGMHVPPANPDIVVRGNGGATALVIEIKNVPAPGASSREAVHQAVTYALSYRVKHVVLVHPRASRTQPAGIRHVGDIKDVSVYQYRFDLGAEDLIGEASEFGREMGILLAD